MPNTISAKQLFDLIPREYRFLTKDEDGAIYASKQRPEQGRFAKVWSANDSIKVTEVIKVTEFENQSWNRCICERESNPQDWIGCLCRFWNCYQSEYVLGVLTAWNPGAPYPFNCAACMQNFVYCVPVKPNEVKFAKTE